MATAFADMQARMGRDVVARLANAAVTLPLGATLNGVLTRHPALAVGLGGADIQTSDLTLRVVTADLVESVGNGTVIGVSGQSLRVRRRDDRAELGQTLLELEATS